MEKEIFGPSRARKLTLGPEMEDSSIGCTFSVWSNQNQAAPSRNESEGALRRCFMCFALDIVKSVLKFAFYLAVTGELASATLSIAKNAHYAQKHMLSLSKFNRQLVGR